MQSVIWDLIEPNENTNKIVNILQGNTLRQKMKQKKKTKRKGEKEKNKEI